MKKWIITPPGEQNVFECDEIEAQQRLARDKKSLLLEGKNWEKEHEEREYESIFSITDDYAVREIFIKNLPEDVAKIFIPGCGSKIELQKHLVEHNLSIEEIHCADWSQSGLETAQKEFGHHPKVRWHRWDTTDLSEVEDGYLIGSKGGALPHC